VHYSHAILGKHIVAQLQARESAPVLIIGEDKFTRAQLSKIGCFNFTAAARLTHLLTTELKVKNTRDLFLNLAPQHLALPGLGAISLATLGPAFEFKNLGPLADYIARHTAKGQTVVTFTTMKIHAVDAEATRKEKQALKTRRAQRGRAAHEHRVARHIARTETAVS